MTATIFLQAAAPTILGINPQFIMFGLIAVVFYFFMIRPQMKKAKDQKKYVEELKKGDKVITTSGIHGKIYEVADTTFLIEVENGGRIRFSKSAISLEESKALNTPAVEKKA
ncbi:preprotein translocase subunit YajC [Mucilaginibacter sp. ZT4R22]|jgi:preprotein translocase subunit YajC|uniref:Sec translocon accessory complex subunit YajC n=1 Tax=Mucilaginibacter pankratovii TaxID=2772110 RepID=A0ABR7WPJ9_9SPHI|nr:preprotein translocase subunit YajC [Mucilaginibacter pankratovii]MBD1364244.1 preprotein translocase subunit YajC [Mucilaginibacter pankratovii]